MAVVRNSYVARYKAYIRWNRYPVMLHIIAYNKCRSHTSAMGMQLKIMRVINYPFILVATRPFDFKHFVPPDIIKIKRPWNKHYIPQSLGVKFFVLKCGLRKYVLQNIFFYNPYRHRLFIILLKLYVLQLYNINFLC